jgi:hypothetical protein
MAGSGPPRQTGPLTAEDIAAAWVFVFRRMPELTGHSLEQIEQQPHFGKFRPKDFADLREEGQLTLHYHPESAKGVVKE